jgi:hypothetical protein
MVATLSLLDVITNPKEVGDCPLTTIERTRIANEMIASLMDEHAHIEEIDTFGPTKRSRRCLTRPNHLVFRRLHEDWLTRAEALRAHAHVMQESGEVIARLPELTDAILRRRSLLQLTVEQIEQGMEAIRQGKGRHYNSVEELRRELRAESERRRAEFPGLNDIRPSGGGVGSA